jgi:pimeloyl-ACP methyl ester carboxylesterase
MHAETRSHPNAAYASMPTMLQSASPTAMYRTARSLVELSSPTIRELLLSLDLPRFFLVGQWTLEADEKPRSGEAGDGLEGSAIRVVVVPQAGHQMMFDNPEGFAQAVADAVRP